MAAPKHRILLRTVVIDLPADVHDRARDFWTAALGASARRGQRFPEYHVLEHPAAVTTVMTQQLKAGGARIHLDIETDDVVAEVLRLEEAGAQVVDRHDDWVVLRDPAGLLFCVVPGEGEAFEAGAVEVP